MSEQLTAELATCDLLLLNERVREGSSLADASVVLQIAESVRQLLRIDTNRALHLAEVCIVVAKRMQDPISMGLSLRAKANALWFRNEFHSASSLYNEAISYFEQIGATEEIGRTLSSSIQSLLLLGEYDRALSAATRAREIFERCGDQRRMARVDINLANMYHRQDKFAEALTLYRQAYDQLIAFRDSEAIGAALHNMAVCLIMLNDFEEAVRTLELVHQVADREMPLLARQAEYNLAYLHFLRGDYNEALLRLRQTRELCERDGDTYHVALCDLDESEIYIELNSPVIAARLAREAMKRFRRLAMPFEQGRSAVNFAIASHKVGSSRRALLLLRRAGEIFRKENNQAWSALVEVYQAMVLLDKGTSRQARAHCRHALQYFRAAGLERREVLCQLVLVRALLSMPRLQSARKVCRQALMKAKTLQAPNLRFQALLLMGHIAYERGDGSALQYYERARTELEQLRTTVQADELKIAFMRDKDEVYEQLVRLCLTSGGNAGQTFEYIESAKSRSLVELIAREMLRFPPAPEGKDERIDTLRRELNWYYHRLELEQNPKEEISPARIRVLRQELAVRENEFLNLNRNIQTHTAPTDVFSRSAVVTMPRLQNILAPDVTLLEYFQLGREFLALTITRRGAEVSPVMTVENLNVTLEMLDFQMARMTIPRRTSEMETLLLRTATSHLRNLYEKVFAPVTDLLKTPKLVIVPHGPLHRLPFHALTDGSSYILDRFIVSYSPSSSVYAACEERVGNVNGKALVIGVPDQNTPGILQEIEAVSAAIPNARTVLGSLATRRFLETEGRDARLIHLATHGVFRRDEPVLSGVRLGDGYLNLTDLYSMHLPVELITLSGCATGLAEVFGGDELVGLTRGLLSAGTRSTVVTLWDVQDQITARFMQEFYAEWIRHGDKALAIRTAMKIIRSDFPHPYYWAPFMLIGSRENAKIR